MKIHLCSSKLLGMSKVKILQLSVFRQFTKLQLEIVGLTVLKIIYTCEHKPSFCEFIFLNLNFENGLDENHRLSEHNFQQLSQPFKCWALQSQSFSSMETT